MLWPVILTSLMYTVLCRETKYDTCPARCKCDSIRENQASNEYTNSVSTDAVGSKMVTCWIPDSTPRLSCGSDWDILHLQILHTQFTRLHTHSNRDRSIISGTSISSELFVNCSSVSRLAIWEKSQFTHLPNTILRPLLDLERLFIKVPSLTTLPAHLFAFLTKIKFVMISKCSKLQVIGRTVFEPCPTTLQTLWLNGNDLKGRLGAGLFSQCDLRTLWLQENRIEGLDWDSLRGLQHLTHLRLDRNKLNGSLSECFGYRKDMQSSAFRETPDLKFLDLSSNFLSSINDYAWSGLCNTAMRKGLCMLEELDLSNNRLEWIGPEAFHGLPKLKKLNIMQNEGLYNPESIGPLALALYGLGSKNQYLDTVLISELSDKALSSGKLSRRLNVCKLDDGVRARLPFVLKQIVHYLEKYSCTSNFSNLSPAVDHKRPSHKDEPNESVDGKFSARARLRWKSIIRMLGKADLLIITLIAITILITGIFIGLIPFTYIICSRKHYRRLNRYCKSQTTWNYVDKGSVLFSNGSQLMHTSPVPHALMTSLSNNTLIGTAAHVAGSNPSSEERKRNGISSQTSVTNQTRRAKSTGNVHRREIHRPPNSPFNHINHTPNHFTPNVAQLRNSVAYPLPVEMRPLIPLPSDGTSESMYAQAAETTGSVYSLATVTSRCARLPHDRVNPIANSYR